MPHLLPIVSRLQIGLVFLWIFPLLCMAEIKLENRSSKSLEAHAPSVKENSDKDNTSEYTDERAAKNEDARQHKGHTVVQNNDRRGGYEPPLVTEAKPKEHVLQHRMKFTDAKQLRDEANSGNVDAQFQLGYEYYSGQAFEQNYKEAVYWFEEAAEKNDADAEMMLAVMYIHGTGVEKNIGTGLQWAKKSAEHGNMYSQLDMAIAYSRGDGFPRDFKEAAKWARMPAEKGLAAAQYMYGLMYLYGNGVVRNEGEAFNWMLKSAQQGYTPAKATLGSMYYFGQGVAPSNVDAFRWSNEAAEEGDLDAQLIVAGICEDDMAFTLAEKWYRKRAIEGNELAQYRLGRMYLLEQVIDASGGGALDWLSKSAKQDNKDAFLLLALMYQDGKGVTQNGVLAYAFYQLGLNENQTINNNRKAFFTKNMAELRALLSQKQIAEANNIKERWRVGNELPTTTETTGKFSTKPVTKKKK